MLLWILPPPKSWFEKRIRILNAMFFVHEKYTEPLMIFLSYSHFLREVLNFSLSRRVLKVVNIKNPQRI